MQPTQSVLFQEVSHICNYIMCTSIYQKTEWESFYLVSHFGNEKIIFTQLFKKHLKVQRYPPDWESGVSWPAVLFSFLVGWICLVHCSPLCCVHYFLHHGIFLCQCGSRGPRRKGREERDLKQRKHDWSCYSENKALTHHGLGFLFFLLNFVMRR